MTNLQEIKGFNIYCGPGVLAALTGKSTDQCAAVISAVSGAKHIKAVQIEHLTEALRRLGFDVEQVKGLVGGMLYSTLAVLSRTDGFYVVRVPHHVIAIEVSLKQVYLIDNHTKSAINAASSARLTQRVEGVFRVKPPRIPTKEEVTAERIKWLADQISILNLQIVNRQEQIRRYEEELKSLAEENK